MGEPIKIKYNGKTVIFHGKAEAQAFRDSMTLVNTNPPEDKVIKPNGKTEVVYNVPKEDVVENEIPLSSSQLPTPKAETKQKRKRRADTA